MIVQLPLMQKPNIDSLWNDLEVLIRKAGAAIMKVRETGNFELELKDDHFPLTGADRDSHNILMHGLAELTPDIRVMSEESNEVNNFKIMEEDYYWCVDPLDGTAEFAKKRNQFVVQAGLIGPDGPIAGIVFAPVFDQLFFGGVNSEAWLKEKNRVVDIRVSDREQAKYAVGSISHLDDTSRAYMGKLGDVELKQYGSALKLTAVAKGEADIYPRFAPTMEWDTAAPHAIVVAAGGKVLGLDGKELKYRKKDLRNPGFICYNGRINLPEFRV